MQQIPKPDLDAPPKPPDKEQEQTWEEDQKKREYYYDDAHGYEKYIPEEPCEKESEDQA